MNRFAVFISRLLALSAVFGLVSCGSDGNNNAAAPVPLTITHLAAGDEHSCALTSSGRLYCWGRHNQGQLGLGDTDTDADDDTDPDNVLAPRQVGTAANWIFLSSGFDHTCAINRSNELFCWGDNSDGQLGIGNSDDQNEPMRVGTESNWATVATGNKHTCATNSANRLLCWGEHEGDDDDDDGADGKLGLGPNADASYDTPQAVGSGTDWQAVYAFEEHTCALTRTNMTMFCWGRNNDGELGLGNEVNQDEPQEIPNLSDWSMVGHGGFEHSCASQASGQLYCWGENNDNELGLNNTEDQNTPQRVGTASNWRSNTAGGNHSCAVNSDGELFCWGKNDFNQLGTASDSEEVGMPTRVGTAADWSLVDAGNDHTCAVSTGTMLFCWGRNEDGQLGLDNTTQQTAPTRVDFNFR